MVSLEIPQIASKRLLFWNCCALETAASDTAASHIIFLTAAGMRSPVWIISREDSAGTLLRDSKAMEWPMQLKDYSKEVLDISGIPTLAPIISF